MTTKQCGNCKWWGLSKKRYVNEILFADCVSENQDAESHVEVDKDETSIYPMADHEGQDCPVFEERKE